MITEAEARNKALELCQKIGKSTMFDKQFNDGMSLPFHVSKKIGLNILDWIISQEGLQGQYNSSHIGYLTSIKEELLKLEL